MSQLPIDTHFIKGESQNGLNVFGKLFDPISTGSIAVLMVHEDFPMVTDHEKEDFLRFALEKQVPAMTGSKARVHPYRLLAIQDGYDTAFADIPQSIRGNRQSYPEVFQFVPALIYLPPRTRLSSLFNRIIPRMYELPIEALYDRKRFTDNLLMESLKNQS